MIGLVRASSARRLVWLAGFAVAALAAVAMTSMAAPPAGDRAAASDIEAGPAPR